MHDVRFCQNLLTESKKCRDNGTLILIMRFAFRERNRERERERERERGRRRGDDEKNG